MATGWSTVRKENTNFARLCKLLIEGGTKVLRDSFDAKHPPLNLKKHLTDHTNHQRLKSLKQSKKLRADQWSKLYPTVGTVTSASFDITLLSLLLRNICNLPTPANGWDKEPAVGSINLEDDIVRLRLFRNQVSHFSKPDVSDADFANWKDIETVLLRRGASKAEIDNLSRQSFDPDDEKYYIECLKEWAENEERLLTEFKKTQQILRDETNPALAQILKNTAPCQGKPLQDVKLYSTNLKEAIKKQTNIQPKGLNQSRVKTDDIFTKLTVHQGILEFRPTCSTQNEIKQFGEIFVDERKEKVKSILLSGEPGIGKTFFSEKLVRDWSTNDIKIPDIQFSYLITFRQLDLLGEKELNLRELLNHCTLLNEKTMIDETLIEYMIQHPEQLFLVFDGLDEYNDPRTIAEKDKGEFPNDAKAKMPVAVLVRKLIHKKIFEDAIIMVTSRPTEANELNEKVHFDRHVKIDGFSESQVIEYVKNYFNSKPEEEMTEEEKKMALEKFKESTEYLALGRVPLRCFLMCPVIEWEIRNQRSGNNSAPLTLTEFYSKVIYCTERHYNRKISILGEKAASSAVKKTLDNLAKLALHLVQQHKFSFTFEELEKLELTNDELTFITSSSLLCCYPIKRNAAYPDTAFEYSFAHLTIQEFLAARYLVTKKKMAEEQMTEMVYIFISGLLGVKKKKANDEMMSKLLECVDTHVCESSGKIGTRKRLVSLLCLHQYGQHQQFTSQVLAANRHFRYWNSHGRIELDGVTDRDCSALAMLLDKLTAASLLSPQETLCGAAFAMLIDKSALALLSPLSTLCNTLVILADKSNAVSPPSPPHTLHIRGSSLTHSGLNSLMPSLTESTITALMLPACELDDKCAQCLGKYLCTSKITELNLTDNKISDNGVEHIVYHRPKCLTDLNLSRNKLTDAGVNYVVNHCASNLEVLCLTSNLSVSDDCRRTNRKYCEDNYPSLRFFI